MSNFRIIEHTVRAQHSRDRVAGAELGRHNELRVHVKQYIPLDNAHPHPGDVTIIGAVADAFPKEVLEPFWSDLCSRLSEGGRRIRAIWVADPVNQGHSGVLNEKILGPDPGWFDHGRDLLFLINHFQDEMPHPLVGIGHSMGAGHIAHLALLHPRLLHCMVLMDPVFGPKMKAGGSWAVASATRRDLWPSRSSATAKFKSNPVFSGWDSRVLDIYIRHGLRDLPTERYPDLSNDSNVDDPPVTLQTPKAQEQYNYIRAGYLEDRYLLQDGDRERDFSSEDQHEIQQPFNRFENLILYRRLSELRPSTLFLLGSRSEVADYELRRKRLELTGTGVGGSGGFKVGKVKEVLVKAGHLVPLEAPVECAEQCARFLVSELVRWDAEEKSRQDRWQVLSRSERIDLNQAWMERIAAIRDRAGTADGKASGKL